MPRPSAADRARRLASQGASLLDTDRLRAASYYGEAIRLDPQLHIAWFDLALIHKWSGNWEEAFTCNLRAAELVGEGADEPAWWNLGIAATALHRWEVARRAWRVYGVAVPKGAGPIEGDYGIGAVRLNPDTEGEVVWGHRVDPARMRLVSIPFPASGHRWSDIVLHDGAPNGYREVDGHQHAVFDELVRWAPSGVPTVEASVSAGSAEEVEELLALVEAAGYAAEDWTRGVRMLCRRCSEGIIHAEHSPAALATGREHVVAIAAPLSVARGILATWTARPGRTCHTIEAAG